jgi:DnaK suppressor protein
MPTAPRSDTEGSWGLEPAAAGGQASSAAAGGQASSAAAGGQASSAAAGGQANRVLPPRASTAADLPVRLGEEPWTDAELKEVQAELEFEAAILRADLAKAASDIAERLTDAVRDAGDDQADAGTKAFEREQELALTQNARDLLHQGERALARIDAGTYGVCESCGKPIGKARLLAFPRATLCVPCKQREERR